MAESWKKLKTSNLFSSFIVSSNRNRSALVRELLCNNSLFVGQLYEYKSLPLRARDLIFFTTEPNSELLHNNSLLELIYFLNKAYDLHHRKTNNAELSPGKPHISLAFAQSDQSSLSALRKFRLVK